MISYHQRIFSAFLYIIPMTNAINYGYDVFINLPFLKLIIFPTLPILYIEKNLPFSSLIIFLLLFLGIAKNQEVSYFIRYNAMQTILIKLALIIFSYINLLIIQLSSNFLETKTLESTIFVSTLAIVIFGIVQCLRGLEPDLPVISQATKMHI